MINAIGSVRGKLARRTPSKGYLRSGLPFARFGNGPRPLVVFQGLAAQNTPHPGLPSRMYGFLRDKYTILAVLRRPGLPQGYTLKDMADDYAAMITEEFGGPVDVIGVSTGGSIALHFAADHPELVRQLIIHSSAHTLSDFAKGLQLEYARLAGLGDWQAAYELIMGAMVPKKGPLRVAAKPLTKVVAWVMSRRPPTDGSDLVVTVQAEDKLAFRDRLHEITAPTLVAAGTEDPGYTPELFRETAEGIPNARLALYEGMGHPARGKAFQRDVLDFLGGAPDL